MKARTEIALTGLDDKLLDGLDFYSKVYDLFDDVRAALEGVAKLRLRPTKIVRRPFWKELIFRAECATCSWS